MLLSPSVMLQTRKADLSSKATALCNLSRTCCQAQQHCRWLWLDIVAACESGRRTSNLTGHQTETAAEPLVLACVSWWICSCKAARPLAEGSDALKCSSSAQQHICVHCCPLYRLTAFVVTNGLQDARKIYDGSCPKHKLAAMYNLFMLNQTCTWHGCQGSE